MTNSARLNLKVKRVNVRHAEIRCNTTVFVR
jgi:hypothetical protein